MNAPAEIHDLARRGWWLFPVRGKVPLTAHGFKDSSTDPAQLDAWAAEHPGCGWAVDLGASKMAAIDIDPRNGGEASWLELLEEHGFPLIDTVGAWTGGGGEHAIFSTNGREIRSCTLAKGIDLKGAGGYIVIAPSPHPSGGRYEWKTKASPAETDLAPFPEWLIPTEPERHAAPSVLGRIPQGQRNATLASLAGSMRRRGMGQASIEAALLAENAARCDPALPEAEVQRIGASVARYAPAPVDLPPPPKRALSKDFMAALAALGWDFKLNLADDSVAVNDAPMTDTTRALLRTQLRDAGYGPLEAAEDAWLAAAGMNSFHPVRDALTALTWDGQDHVGRLAGFLEDAHGVLAIWLRRWLIGAVARALRGGVQNRVLVLDGPQGIGKSWLVRWLGSVVPGYTVEAPIIPDDKDSALRLIGAWLWEVPELGHTIRRADREALKFFLSMEQVTVRRPYGRFDIRKPALASFVATVNNESGFLADPTGTRRFMATTVTRIDWGYAEALRPEDVWAQAVAMFKAGEPWHLPPAEAARAAEINELYAVGDPVEDAIEKFFTLDPRDVGAFLPTAEIAETVGDRVKGLGADVLNRRIGAVLAGSGLRQDRISTTEGRVRGWYGVRRRIP